MNAFENNVRIHFLFNFFASGFESVGPSNVCKAYEAKRSHRQRQVVAPESRWHSGDLLKTTEMSVASRYLIPGCVFRIDAVPVGELRRDHPLVVTRPAEVHRHVQGTRRRRLGPAGQRGLHTRILWRQGQEDLLHGPEKPGHPCAHLRGKGSGAQSKKSEF